ncbi:MAG: tetratricopeptide repeat protein [Tepidisphaeraceae bacterium]|jgi:protein O-GlcNAc transferase
MPSVPLEQALNMAMQRQQAGKLVEAERLYRQILAQQPDCADALHLLGVVCAQAGRHQEGVELIRGAITLHPGVAGYHANLGKVFLAAKSPEQAAGAFGEAVRLNPDDGESPVNLATALNGLGRFDEAADCCRRELSIHPDSAGAHQVLADALRESGRIDESIAEYERAIALPPVMAASYNNLALALSVRMRFDEALAALDKAIALRPNWDLIWNNRAKVLRDCGRLEESLVSARRALAISPNLAEGHVNLAGALLDALQIDEALASARRAVELGPDLAEAHNILANSLKEAGAVAETLDALDHALKLRPNDHVNQCNRVYILQFDHRARAKSLLAEQRRWNDLLAAPMQKFIRPHENDRSPDRRLRVGYVSPYFYDHAESFFVVPLLESHDREQVEVFCYSDGRRTDAVTRRLQRCAHVWHMALGRTDEELAEQIRRDRIDVLVDLAMHMSYNRLLTFAQRPAPVQVAWLAYPGGTGLEEMDYRITDPWIDPPGMDESCYREQSVRLPSTWACYDPLCDVAPAATRIAGPIRFGSINNPCKLNDPLLQLWAKVLHGVCDSRLILQSLCEEHRRRIVGVLNSSGVASDRIEFVGRYERPEYLRLYDRIDVCLDPLPYNGITTSCDALWMGVPIVTLAGRTAAGRAGTSILENLGLHELAAGDGDQFVQIATALAGDLPRLAELRRSLRDRMRRSPLMDGVGFARAMEAAYRGMWRAWAGREIRNPKSE